jgi:hypothetical protein
MTEYRCPRCRFGFTPRAHWLAPDFCPRCLAKHSVAIKLVQVTEAQASTRPTTTQIPTADMHNGAARKQLHVDRQHLARVVDARERLDQRPPRPSSRPAGRRSSNA